MRHIQTLNRFSLKLVADPANLDNSIMSQTFQIQGANLCFCQSSQNFNVTSHQVFKFIPKAAEAGGLRRPVRLPLDAVSVIA